MKEHYICTGGCKGISLTPGTCQAESCAKHGQPLEACHCQSEGHDEKSHEKNENK
ncbi:MAG: hypothetical protein WCG55_00365 [bacterium]